MRNPLTRGAFRFTVHSAGLTSIDDEAPPVPAPAPPKQLSRHERRKNATFSRRLKKRLEDDGTPVSVEVLPDGGLHVTVKKEEP